MSNRPREAPVQRRNSVQVRCAAAACCNATCHSGDTPRQSARWNWAWAWSIGGGILPADGAYGWIASVAKALGFEEQPAESRPGPVPGYRRPVPGSQTAGRALQLLKLLVTYD